MKDNSDYIMQSAKQSTSHLTPEWFELFARRLKEKFITIEEGQPFQVVKQNGFLIPITAMSTPVTKRYITCPESGEKLEPSKTFKGAGGIEYGVFKKHHHKRAECDYSDLVARVEEEIIQEEYQPPYVI